MYVTPAPRQGVPHRLSQAQGPQGDREPQARAGPREGGAAAGPQGGKPSRRRAAHVPYPIHSTHLCSLYALQQRKMLAEQAIENAQKVEAAYGGGIGEPPSLPCPPCPPHSTLHTPHSTTHPPTHSQTPMTTTASGQASTPAPAKAKKKKQNTRAKSNSPPSP